MLWSVFPGGFPARGFAPRKSHERRVSSRFIRSGSRALPALSLLLLLMFGCFNTPVTAQTPPVEPFRILICNDDGIDSEGILALAKELEKIASITVVAPAENFSGAGHSLTIQGPLTVSDVKREGKFFGVKVNATPATCMKLAIDQICEKRPNLVVTGINEGDNLGLTVLVSGTFNSAQEGLMKGIPAISVSLGRSKNMDYSMAAGFTREFIQAIRPAGFPTDAVININVPNVTKEELKGIAFTRLSDFQYKEVWVPRKTPWGQRYFWQSIKKPTKAPEPGTDWWADQENMISVTLVPLALDEGKCRHQYNRLKLNFNGKALTDCRNQK